MEFPFGAAQTKAADLGRVLINNLFMLCKMIRSFADKDTDSLFRTGKSRKLPPR